MTSRREFLQISGFTALAASWPAVAQEPRQLPLRQVAGTDQALAIIGLGNSSAFRSGDRDTALRLLRIFIEHGGSYVDVAGLSSPFVGGLARELGATEQLFLGNYIDPGEAAAMRDVARSLIQAQNKTALDLVHTPDVAGYRASHDTFRALRDDGLARFIGVARTGAATHEAIAQLVEDGLVDFIQVNYSMLEPQAGERLLPLAQDKGVGVAISRPFINGNYFRIVSGHELPEWAREFDCHSWAQFSLKFILANPAVTCVLTETANPEHAVDNIGAGFGRLPDAAMRRRMLAHMRSLR